MLDNKIFNVVQCAHVIRSKRNDRDAIFTFVCEFEWRKKFCAAVRK